MGGAGQWGLSTFAWSTTTSAWLATNGADTLVAGSPGLVYTRRADDSRFQFDAAGRLLAHTQRNGWVTSYTYSTSGTTSTTAPLAGLLTSVSNQFTRTLSFSYDTAGMLIAASTPDAQTVSYAYASVSPTTDSVARLSTVTHPGSASGTVTRAYLYENTKFVELLTGIVDEDGVRYSLYEYDSDGRAIGTRLGTNIDWYDFAYSGASVTVGDPLAAYRTYTYDRQAGQLAVIGATAPSGIGAPDAASRVQDSSGVVTSQTDFKGITTTFAWDTARHLLLETTQAAGTADQRTLSTQWHATMTLPVLVTQTGRATAYTYDAAGNTLSKAVGDTVAGTTRTWAWTYNAQGLAATMVAPNGATTTYAYDSVGNTRTATNALGQATAFSYDGNGRVTQQTDPNGKTTTFAYDLRGRLTAQTSASEAITLTYNPTGTIASARQMNGRTMSFAYDIAKRLIGWADSNGVTASYTLDPMGNRIEETIGTASAVAWRASRAYNTLNQLIQESVGGFQTTTFTYDANGELVKSTNGLNQTTTFGLDNLRRLKTETNPLNRTATLTLNPLDAITSAVDFKGVTTTFTRSAYGEPKVETSNDIGSHTKTFTALGLPSTVVDSLAQTTTLQYDLLGRPTQLTYQGGRTATLAYDTTGLSQIVDGSGTTSWQRDGQGRVTARVYTTPSGAAFTTTFTFNSLGQLGTLTYPGGGALGYVYGSGGRITQLNWNGSALVSSITWDPTERPKSWVWNMASSVPAQRTYDTAGNLKANGIATYNYNAAGRISTLVENRLAPSDTNPANSGTATTAITWTAVYDSAGRVTAFRGSGGTTTFTYDTNGNRLTSTSLKGTTTFNRNYTVTASTNKLSGYTQTTNVTGSTVTTTVSYSNDANGALIQEGTREFHYDAEQRLNSSNNGVTSTSPVTRYAHNVLGERTFKTVPVLPNATDTLNLTAFYARAWNPTGVTAEQQGWAFIYADDGTLLGQYGTGGVATGTTQFIVLPTPNGPMPIAAIIDGNKYGIYADHLNTPRRMINSTPQWAWQWGYSGFGDEPATTARYRFGNLETNPNPGTTTVADLTLNLRYPGQVYDSESKLHYNYFRSYKPDNGRYTQADPIGLDGGWNRFAYAAASAMNWVDSDGRRNMRQASPYGQSAYVPSTRERSRSDGVIPNGPPSMSTNTAARDILKEMGNIPTSVDANLPGVFPGFNYVPPISTPIPLPMPVTPGCIVIRRPPSSQCTAQPDVQVICGPTFSERTR